MDRAGEATYNPQKKLVSLLSDTCAMTHGIFMMSPFRFSARFA